MRDLNQGAMINLIASNLKNEYERTNNVTFLINLANSVSPNLGIIGGDFQVAVDGSAIHIPDCSPEELARVNNVDAVRVAIRNFAAGLVYEHYIQNVGAADNDKMAALKAIADVSPGETAAHIKNRLHVAQNFLMPAPPAPAADPAAPAPAPTRLSDNLAMLSDEKVIQLRKQAAEHYFMQKLESINDHNQLLDLLNAQTLEQFRAALNVNGVAIDPANPMKSLNLGPDNTNQSVFTDEDLRKFKKDFVIKRHNRIVGNARIVSGNEDANSAINALMNQAKVTDAATRQQALSFMAEGHILFSEFKETLVPNLFRSLYNSADGLLRGSVSYSGADIDNQIEIIKSNNTSGKNANNVPIYSVKLPQNVTLTEKALGENKVESRVSSSEILNRNDLFLIAARALYHRFKDVLKLDPANHVLKVTAIPSFIDKEGNPIEYRDFKDDFRNALTQAGFTRVELPAVLAAHVALDPAALGGGAAPPPVPAPGPVPGPVPALAGGPGGLPDPDPRPAPVPAPGPACATPPVSSSLSRVTDFDENDSEVVEDTEATPLIKNTI